MTLTFDLLSQKTQADVCVMDKVKCAVISLSLSLSLSILTAIFHFPGEPGLAGVY